MRAHTITAREMTTGQRQIRVGELFDQGHGPEAIAEQLDISADLVRQDLADMEIEGYESPQGGPRSARPACGTKSGYDAHKYRKEDACAECLDANNRNQKARSIRAGRSARLSVSVIAIAELYLHAPEAQRQRLADELGTEVCEALVDYHDQIERATGR